MHENHKTIIQISKLLFLYFKALNPTKRRNEISLLVPLFHRHIYISYITCFVFVKLPRLLTKSRLVICRVIPSRNNLRYLKPLPWLRQRPLSAAVYLPSLSLSEHFMYTAANLILFSLLYFNLWGFVVFTETMRNVFFDFWSLVLVLFQH